MKSVIQQLIGYLLNRMAMPAFSKSLRSFSAHTKFYFIDIDNTLADTWPTLQQQGYSSQNDRFSSLPVFRGMHKTCIQLFSDPINRVYFITARPDGAKVVTMKWLHSIGLNISTEQLIVVRYAFQKIDYINAASTCGFDITYIDDLSFGQEKGMLKFYENEISSVKQLPIQYLGYREIQEINHI